MSISNQPNLNSFQGIQLAPETKVSSVNSSWNLGDYLGALKVRSSWKRNNYTVEPGLYRIGKPESDSEVFVSANYKLSFDILRKNLKDIDAWILVLDTKGINVWCAAGKGTFGTGELIHRIQSTNIANRIDHKRLILPQLGAPGVSAHKVKESTGLTVKYGPVRANDIPDFLKAGNKATEEMRSVKFSFYDRLILTPVELVYGIKHLLLASILFLLITAIGKNGLDANNLLVNGTRNIATLALAFLSGTFIGPILLPLLPFRSFSIKGAFAGAVLWMISAFLLFKSMFSIESLAFLPVFLALGSFYTMNFTGASTYTSLSGVKKEMKFAVPIQISLGIAGVLLFVTSRFV